jgi:hypothetical protein
MIFREGTQIKLMIKISHDHNHHDHLRSLSAFQSKILNRKSKIALTSF